MTCINSVRLFGTASVARLKYRLLVQKLRHSRLSNLIVRNLVGFMYFEEVVPAAKCDTLANTYL